MYLSELFEAMKDGGKFLMRDVPHFNGGLFERHVGPGIDGRQIKSTCSHG